MPTKDTGSPMPKPPRGGRKRSKSKARMQRASRKGNRMKG